MSDSFIIVILLILIYILCKDEIEGFTFRENICNSLDGRCYPIVSKYKDQQYASQILAQLNSFCITVMRHLRQKYLWTPNSNAYAKELVTFLLSNYNPDGIIENDPKSDVNTSYVDDKGRVFAICLREKASGKHNFHDINLLQYVVLHEMAHMATISFGHEQDFWKHFKFLIGEAIEAGVHTPVNYKRNPTVYCSLNVNYNPYFDSGLYNI